MNRNMVSLGLVVALALTAASRLPAAEPSKSADAAKQEAQAGDVELLASAYRLAEIGEKQKLPEAYVTAGSLVLKLKALTKGEMGELSLTPEVLDENGKRVENAKVESQKPESLEEMVENYFDAAAALAAQQKTSKEVAALIKAAKSRDYNSGTRGATGGPKIFSRSLGPHQSHVYEVRFETYAMGAVGFQSSAPTRCEMHIGSYVAFNQVVTIGNFTWKPKEDRATKVYTITVRNGHDFPVTYKLFTN